MLPQDLLSFLEELKANNSKEWFDDNRDRYQGLRKDFVDFINQLIPKIAEFDPMILPLESKNCMFRINRDIRFSKDKTPYKTNFGAFMANGGRKSRYAGYYLHIEPGGCFLGGGIYMPPNEILKEIRQEIYFEIDKFKEIISDKAFKKYFKGIWEGEKLKSAPRGFPKDFPDIELLKHKHYTVTHQFKDEIILKKNFTNNILKIYKEMYPLNYFVNKVIDNM
jgi:uncharacterized protein (TIGR02453 family)